MPGSQPDHSPLRNILKRFPGWTEVLSVYAVIAFVVYAWALLWFFWQLPGWLFYLNLNDILSALTYVLATNFAESLLVLCGTLVLTLIFPSRWFRDVFVARGASLCVAMLAYMMFLSSRFQDKMAYPALPLAAWSVPVALLAIALIAFVGAVLQWCGGWSKRSPTARRSSSTFWYRRAPCR